jgi:hypothetical protein
MEVPAFVGDRLEDADYFVSYDNPKAVAYARGHLDEIKEHIDNVLRILFVHGEDVAQVSREMQRWLDQRVQQLTQ